MPEKSLHVWAVSYLVLSITLGLAVSGQRIVGLESDLQVMNVDTGLRYSRIQEAIDASETLSGHTIRVGVGVFRERVTVNKSVSLVGESRDASVIDGSGGGVVVQVTTNEVEVRNLSIRNGTFGVWLHHSNNSAVLDNNLQIGTYGIRLYYSRNSVVVGNHVSGYRYFGIQLDSSGNSTLRNNVMVENTYNFGVDGTSLADFLNDIDSSNTVNGNPVRYLVNQRDVLIDSWTFYGLGYLGLVNSTNVKVQNLDIRNNIQGILFAFASNASVSDVSVENNWYGIYVVHSRNASVTRVNANHNFDYGIKFRSSPGSVAFQNNVDNNGWAGIGLFDSDNSVLDSNEVSYGSYDLHLVYTNNSVITRNTALIKPGAYSVALYYSHNNSIYHNTFENSLLYAETRNRARFVPKNLWDNGVEGNYWLTYRGADLDHDGVGDAPYDVGENNTDSFPLMGRFSEFDVFLDGRSYDVTLISNSTIDEFWFDVKEGKMSFNAIGQNGTLGFCRVAVPVALLQELESGDLGFLVNGEEPFLERHWGDKVRAYWYLSFVNSPLQSASDPLSTALVILLFLFLAVVSLMVLRKRKVRPE